MKAERVIWSIMTTVIVWILVLIGLMVYFHKQEKVDTYNHVPTFQRGDCFKLNSSDEDWELIPDGIIERVGKMNYLVIWREQAEKRGGDKYGSTLETKVFDQMNVKVDCPATWKNHTHKSSH